MVRPVLPVLGLLIALTAGCARYTAPAGDLLLADGVSSDLAVADSLADGAAAGDLLSGHGPPFPLVLAHGAFSFDQVGPLDYFYKVKGTLEADGHVVELGILDPFNSTSERAPKLLTKVKEVLQQTGAAKVNIIANSQGGFAARYVASQIPDRVAAVVSIGSPHKGLYLADVMLGYAPGFSVALAEAFFKAVGRPFFGAITDDTDMKACLESMSTPTAEAFNAQYPDNPRVTYYSIGGRSNLELAENECSSPQAPAFVSRYNQIRDPVDPLLFATAQLIGGLPPAHKPNDGLIRVESTKWGNWLGCIPADHFDQIGQILGDSPGLGNPFDHLTFYRDLAAFLVRQGF